METDIKINADSDEVLLLNLFWKIEAKNDEIKQLQEEIERYKVLLGEKMPEQALKEQIGELCSYGQQIMMSFFLRLWVLGRKDIRR